MSRDTLTARTAPCALSALPSAPTAQCAILTHAHSFLLKYPTPPCIFEGEYMELSVAVLFIKCYVYRTFSFLKPFICSLSCHLQMKMILFYRYARIVLLGFRLPAESTLTGCVLPCTLCPSSYTSHCVLVAQSRFLLTRMSYI